MDKCQVCDKLTKTKVASIPGVPYSAAYCNECFDANAHPYEIVVANTWSVGGYKQCADWWQSIVDDTLSHLKISRKQFDKDVEELEEKES